MSDSDVDTLARGISRITRRYELRHPAAYALVSGVPKLSGASAAVARRRDDLSYPDPAVDASRSSELRETTALEEVQRLRLRLHGHPPPLPIWPPQEAEPPSSHEHEHQQHPPTHAPEGRPRPTASIHHLASELLLAIFRTVVALEPRAGNASTRYPAPTRLMLVCRHWRALVLHTPEFWRTIDATPEPRKLAALLARSRPCTLDVHVFHPWAADPGAIALLVPHAARVRSLVVGGSSRGRSFDVVRPLFEAGMPALERLELVPTPLFHAPMQWLDYGLSRERYPRLVELAADSVVLPRPTHFWRNLRVLRLSSFASGSTVGQTRGRRLIAVIALNPRLEELYLLPDVCTISNDEAREVAAAPPEMISLPHLRVFCVGGSYQFLTALFACLLLPRDIPRFEVDFVHRYIEDDAARAFPAHFHPILERMTEVDAAIWPLASDRMKLAVSSPHRPWPRTVQDILSISLSGKTTMHPCEMVVILPVVPITSMVLRLQSSGPYSESYRQKHWVALFDSYRGLRELQLTMYDARPRAAESLLHMLKTLSIVRPKAGAVHACAPLRCPHLRRLAIHTPLPDSRYSRDVLSWVLDVAAWRAKTGGPLASLDLHFWHRNGAPLEPKHRELLAQIRGRVADFRCKFGFSLACRSCR
ncbi:hypothetical protein PYCCODRAFT_1296164 [Trametes coccinea BRFM310]|uniref:Uncharacterized protein n=1 Tax=Trametes coccinea (strain BRFM310) TaxID=1353009 RepID=A0A1Y2IYX9_TRAC3|nr:hypothetical protein PYCCODRAFT_1296164 [Trametes coccinea BRFM310]